MMLMLHLAKAGMPNMPSYSKVICHLCCNTQVYLAIA
jgi:hypothetical protein